MSLHEPETIQRYRTMFEDRKAEGWLGDVQAQAFEAFAACGFPTRKLEEWRHTNPASIAAEHWNLAPTVCALGDLELPDFGGSRIVFANGLYAAGDSRIAGEATVEVSTLAECATGERLLHHGALAPAKDNGFTAWGTAFANDGVVVTLKPSDSPPSPLHVVFVSSDDAAPLASFPRVLIVAEPGSRGQVVVDHVSAGTGKHLCCAVSEILVEENATLDLVLVQRENEQTDHVSRQCVRQQRNSHFSIHTLNLGSAILRNDLEVVLADQGAACNLEGLFLGRGGQLVDNHTLVDHAMPHCTSDELYKGIVADESRGVFRGRVVVRPDAQQTAATQGNQNLVLGSEAEIDTKPQLEIYADDVKCSHGSSIGQLDEEALFFLRTRGLDKNVARTLLMSGFASQITQSIPNEAVREWAAGQVSDRLGSLLANRGAA
ncbi:MAG: Fe-S cluster assembly protein SufD [bacterium]|nr:Fe-S cluster assembly protein SufD [bacterium]